MVIFVAILLLTLFLAHGMVPDGTYRQIFFGYFGVDEISCSFNEL